MSARSLSLAILTVIAVCLPGTAAASTRACSTAAHIRCFAQLQSPQARSAPAGYAPSQLRAAYSAPPAGTATVAIVGAYGDPAIKADLDTFSRNFGLPVMSQCTSRATRSCFERTDQRGGQSFPRTDKGWAVETALDVETVHGICPGCRIELVEADSATTANLMEAVDRAVALGAQVVSMSWGGSEAASETSLDNHFRHPGTIFVASSGDSGYGVSYPASSANVLAVGGTHLVMNSGARAETAWTGSGSGCSAYEPKPTWQHDPSCARRSVADLAADADPATGASVYSSLSSGGIGGWFVVGGTSLSAPLMAGLVAASGVTRQEVLAARLYASLGTTRLNDVTSGRTGTCSTYLCRALTGYDGPTGVGSLNGLSAL